MELHLQDNYLNPDKLEHEKPRDGSGKGVADLGGERQDVVAASTDVKGSARAKYFAERFPERFVQLGVAEQNAAGVCAGLALNGRIPYYFAYAIFAVGRNWEPVRTLLGYQNVKVRICASHAGIATGPDGATHQMTEDIAIMRSIPNVTVIAPADYNEAYKAAQAVVDIDGPVYMRLARPKFPVFTTEQTPFEVGKALPLKDGNDATIVTTGSVAHNALMAAYQLEEEQGISVGVLHCHTVKPLDEAAVIEAAQRTGRIITVEDHQVMGGLGGAVAEIITANHPVPVLRHGVHDRFGESGSPEELYTHFQLDESGVAAVVADWLSDV